jgi:transcriptional/translational regulatory protein YebC/TACO1
MQEVGYTKIITAPEDLHSVEEFFGGKNIEIFESKLDYIPDTEMEIDDFDKVLKLTKMLEAFDEDEDVNIVSTNEIISDKLQKQVDEFIEKNTFRT